MSGLRLGAFSETPVRIARAPAMAVGVASVQVKPSVVAVAAPPRPAESAGDGAL
jgi:hypothetical protein